MKRKPDWKATNVLFNSESNLNPMRLILGRRGCRNRKEYDRICDRGATGRTDYPLVVVRKGQPHIWIEDDIGFLLDNMTGGCQDDWPDGLREWWDEIESSEYRVGAAFRFSSPKNDVVITAIFDGTPMTGLRRLREREL